MSIGDRIKEARKAKGWTQQQLADELGVTAQAVSQWENDKTLPSFSSVAELGEKIGVNLQKEQTTLKSLLINYDKGPNAAVRAPKVSWRDRDTWLKVDWDYENIMIGDPLPPIEFLEVSWKPIGDIFALTCQEWNMQPFFNEGDDIIIDTGRAPEKGDFVVADVDGWLHLARYFPRGLNKNHAQVFELRFEAGKPILVNEDVPGYVVGTVRERRTYFRTI